MNREIYLIGLNHRTAGVEIREAFALTETGLLENDLLPVSSHCTKSLVKEALVLSTCNRVEILAVGKKDTAAHEYILNCWAAACNKSLEELRPYVYIHKGKAAISHLFTVASSLDSMIIGEPQILGQLKDAYKHALKLRKTKAILNRLLHRAFSVAKRVRNETGIASSAVSISYAAVELAKRIFGDMSKYKAMLIGAGEMAELAATHLITAGIQSVWVANRTHEKAIELATQYKGIAVPFEGLFEHLHEVDIIISSTGAPEAVIRAKDLAGVMRRRKNRPMFFIDIAVPRDIAPDVNSLDNIYLYDIDDLKEVVEENLEQRRAEAIKAKSIVDLETESFIQWLDSLNLQPTIVELVQRAEKIAEEELSRTIKRLGGVDQNTEEALQTMLYAILKKLNHEPIAFLKRRFEEKEAGTHYISLIRRIFNLDEETVPENAHHNRKV